MQWTFETCLLLFLIISAISHIISVKTRSIISLQLCFGSIFIIGIIFQIFPPDFIPLTKLLAVGTIAFNVLVINSGTQFSITNLIRHKKTFLFIVITTLISGSLFLVITTLLFSNQIAVLSLPSIIGSGATCAIGNIGALNKVPKISLIPWLIFMFQSPLSIVVFVVSIKRLKLTLIPGLLSEKQRSAFYKRISTKYKSPAYYLAILMTFSVLNKALFGSILSGFGLSINLTALLIGITIGNLNLVDESPLDKTQSMGLLMLGLMALMANSILKTPLPVTVSLIPIAFIVTGIYAVIAYSSSIFISKLMGIDKFEGLLITSSTLIMAPVNAVIIKNVAKENKDELLAISNVGSLYVNGVLSIILISIVIAFI